MLIFYLFFVIPSGLSEIFLGVICRFACGVLLHRRDAVHAVPERAMQWGTQAGLCARGNLSPPALAKNGWGGGRTNRIRLLF